MLRKYKLVLFFKGEDLYTETFYRDDIGEGENQRNVELCEGFWEVYSEGSSHLGRRSVRREPRRQRGGFHKLLYGTVLAGTR